MVGGRGGGRKGLVPRCAARSEPSKKVEPVRLSVDDHQCRTARVPGCAYPEDTAGVCKMTGHLKLLPLQATPTQKISAPGAQVNRQSNNSTEPRGVYSPLWSLLVDNRVAEVGNKEAEGKAGWEEKRRWMGERVERRVGGRGEGELFLWRAEGLRAAGVIFRQSP